MAGRLWLILFLISFLTPVKTITNGKLGSSNFTGPKLPNEEDEERCSTRVEKALLSMSRRRSGGLELGGYALRQSLRSAPYDMLVSDMRVRAPMSNWARVDRCRWDPLAKTLQTRLQFRDLVVSGAVKLKQGSGEEGEACNMTLRMRRAGLGFTVAPSQSRSSRSVKVSTAATFVEPQFVSVHAYGCKSPDEIGRRLDGPEGRSNNRDLEVTQEMEDVFLRGVRSLLTRFMEHQLEPALRDTLMVNLGYSLSYGKR